MTDKNINLIKSPCPNKALCGSCEWSEISYEDQLAHKLKGINDCFASGGIDFRVSKIESSPKTSHYRNRMDFAIDYHGKFGLREKGKWWKVIDSHTCFISDEKIEEAFWKCNGWVKNCGLSYLDRKKWEGLLSYLVLRCTKSGELMINVVTSSNFLQSEESSILEKILMLKQIANPATLVWSTNYSKSDISFGDKIKVLHGSGYITEEIGGIKYRITPSAFFQTNSHAAEILQTTVINMAKSVHAKSILDLYCGSGFFSIALTNVKVTGVEIIEEAILTAKINAETNKSSAEFVCAKSEDLTWQKIPADLVILDPPRSGLHKKVIETLVQNLPKNIIYVSCNYVKFVEELKVLSEKYSLTKSVAVDMFPHTPHVELVSLLTLKS